MDLLNTNSEVVIDGLIKFGISFGKCILILFIGFAVVKLISPHLRKFLEKICHDPIVERFVFNLTTYLLKFCVVLMAVTAVGVETASLVALLGSIGFAIGLAFQGALSNFAGGILLLTQRPFSVDDYIDVVGQSGLVHSISIFSTILYTTDNKVTTIPNGQIVSSPITNYSKLDTRRVDLVVGASYTENSERVLKVINSVVDKHTLIIEEPERQVFLSGLKDSCVEYTIRVWTKTEDYWTVHNELLEDIKITFDNENIEIPYNKLDVNIIK